MNALNSKMNLKLDLALSWLSQARGVNIQSVTADRVHTDSRSLQAGDLFVALRGERFDGNEFIAQAKAQGAVAVVCEASGEAQAMAHDLPALVVSDARIALGELAAGWRAQFDLPVIAVTGSNGKTTVTQMIASILRAHAGKDALSTQGNLNNDIGVPLTLFNLRAHHRIAVVELGMNHPGEIAYLSKLAQPNVALVNNAQREHQEFMGTVEAVAHENGAVLQALPLEGVAVFPSDDVYTPIWQALSGHRVQSCFAMASANEADVRATVVVWQSGAWQFTLKTPEGTAPVRLHIAGRHNVKNALAASACALAAGVPLAVVAQGLLAFEPVKGRSRALVLHSGGADLTLIDDTYNANPDSVRAAIDVLAELPAPRLLVLGDMGEVGNQGPEFHAEVGAYAAERGIESLFTLGDLCVHSAQAFAAARHFPDMANLLAAVTAQVGEFQSVVVKGSRFMKMERVVEALLSIGEAHHTQHNNKGEAHAA
ncbi:UDP-N-acetylmuramoyl-tripeptide--D-alanyl-D-alanine ligase [Limnohabitans sp.]|jgi:UDP-N-acetylmuramoyl-tripeptide--D-alanyl-D-alanine ligase|uniref:UDP-N-acetylmuramoyl-tripeptide--D-alanyl-D- alanine ligase n=1 Tax=Limnohabitans sp. TaxID=1907725 RepID=UPI0028A28CF5|nr:UDP-N-acetylmuramoyl-tripeptide--D-alanyl-D-alanine ligase [Limnohabitans sp.]